MKKLIKLVPLMLLVIGLAGCGNWNLFDTDFTYEYAIIETPTGEIIEGNVDNWNGGEYGRVKITIDGETYLVGNDNMILMQRKPN